ncbi:hypothetical protein ERO13_A12G268450v2 [Gossypium hirsutum]|uniref:Uncharacterized protein n=4 Tax=Gossypium TaxID=3633 RepID=A0A5J5TFV7_GOSBA|nr:hypothetical protein ES319_A12G278000v1 [Gossypium barbadense]KAG4172359.1 hypothetical protein ERO13_A12G268450v2 [Gossypium hirsutum]TYG91946.1 hypothetical protein ES288_A12G303800v1 [Gossypium darwinii]TYH98361.1 hypothetical protein ES332_A12G304900v1 [Gossypium tomentosum]TYJ07254.1 hypothetical protein E1A91_A12G292300v1 [Gossypium mustelinum]
MVILCIFAAERNFSQAGLHHAGCNQTLSAYVSRSYMLELCEEAMANPARGRYNKQMQTDRVSQQAWIRVSKRLFMID